MLKIDPKKIYFLDVEDDDCLFVDGKIKGSNITKESFNEKTAEKYKDAEVLSTFITSELSGKNLSKCPNLKLLVTRSVGYNHVDLKWCDENGVKVCNVPDYGAHVIAEHVFALLLASTRHIIEGEERTEDDSFRWQGLRGIALKGKTIGVIGTGKIGLHACRIASLGFLMDVIAYDPHPNKDMAQEYHFDYVDSIDEIWKRSDIITLHTPLFPSTKHMINEESINKMKDGVCLINTARGGLIDTKALVKYVKKGKFGGVALDVIEHEKNLKKDKELLHLPNVIITPHIAFYADDSMGCMYNEAVLSIERFINDEELVHQVIGH